MLRLWPKTLHVGLFPHHCWLRMARGVDIGSSVPDATDPASLLLVFSDMIEQHAGAIGKQGRIALIVSDSLASIVALPWQDALSRPAELDAYAHACFERQGQILDGAWVMRNAFLRCRAMGLAYALPRAWLEQLRDIVGAHDMRLQSVLPASAAAYGCQPRVRGDGRVLQLLRETGRSSALVYSRAGLIDYAVEPGTRTSAQAETRLLRKMSGAHAIGRVDDWSPGAAPEEGWSDRIMQNVPQAVYAQVARHGWS